MARVSWDIVRGICDREGLDHLCVRTTDKKGKIYEADGAADVLSGIEEVRSQIDGDVLVEAWKGTARKDTGYAWTVGSGQRQAAAGIGSGAGPGWEAFVNLKVEHETLKLRQELEPRDNDFGELFGLLKAYAPAIAAQYGVKAPQTVASVPTPPAEEEAPSGMGKEDLAAMLREVAIFAKRNPEEARSYMEILRNRNASPDA